MKLIAGLGNPGPQYANTRHNAGFMLLDRLAYELGAPIRRGAHQGLIGEAQIGGEKVILLKPLTYMNLSGQSVVPALRYYKLGPGDLIVVSDDLDLPLGKLRLRTSGSSGGQRGLQSIIQMLGTQDFARLKCGIGRPPQGVPAADYVLAPFDRNEQPVVAEMVQRGAELLRLAVTEGFEAAMQRFHSA